MAAPMQRAWLELLRAAVPAVRSYHARPLRCSVYRPDLNDPLAPSWQLQPAYEAKLYGRHGSASGVDPAQLWPSPEKLQEMEAEEREWYPGLREVEAALDKKEQEEERQRVEREKLIAAKMAKMPQMIEEWRREKAARKEKERENRARRELLIAKARETFGDKMHPSNPKFQELLQDLEKKERKELKLKKKQVREEARMKALADVAPEPASVSAEEAEPV